MISDTKQKRLSYFNQNNLQEETQNQLGEGEGTHEASPDLKHRSDSEVKKMKNYQNVLTVVNWIENQETSESLMQAQTGAVTYSLPCGALQDRTIRNEISRLHIELYNKKILEMYEDPNSAYSQYEEQVSKLKKLK